jgi:hypothetical protein
MQNNIPNWQRGHPPYPQVPEILNLHSYWSRIPRIPIPVLSEVTIGLQTQEELERLSSLIIHTDFLVNRLRDIHYYWVNLARAQRNELSQSQLSNFVDWCIGNNINPPGGLQAVFPVLQPLNADLLAPEVINLLTDSDTESEAEELPILVQPEDMQVEEAEN